MRTKTAYVLAAAAMTATAWGCGGGKSAPEEDIGNQRASLHRAKSCGDLLSDLKTDAIYKLDKGIARQIESIQKCIAKNGDAKCASYGYYGGFGGAERGAATDASAGAAPPQASGDKATAHSETNTQVKGVDEADIVKTDGKYLFVIHGRAFKILNAWPANTLEEVSSFDVEGSPSEMFVADGKAVIYSTVNGAKIFEAAGVTPKEQYRDYYYYDSMGGGGVGASDARAPAPCAPGTNCGGTPEKYIPLTKITVLNLNGTSPTIAREVYFEGSYLDSRRVGPNVRTVLQGSAHGPRLKYGVWELFPQAQPGDVTTQVDWQPKTGTDAIALLNKLRQENVDIINASVIGDWIPFTFVKNGSAISAQTIPCEDFYVPNAGSTESGITEVASLDLADPAATPKETAILGRADTVYGSLDTLYLAARAWVQIPWGEWDGDVAVSSDGTRTPTTLEQKIVTAHSTAKTHVHKFEFQSDPKFPNYQASGTVVGTVKNQFSLDHKDGYLRIATTEQRQYLDQNGKWVQPDWNQPGTTSTPVVRPSTVNRLFVLGQNGGWLDQVGDAGELAPNERIFSVRFLDGRGYVVTFRQVDPLFVFDLQNPKAPTLLAALKIPGFSEYMHPLDANHILTIGRDATATGQARGLQLQIFDVTDGTNPIVKQKFTYTGAEYGSSEAEYDHKAFTYFADRQLLAFPYMAYNSTTYAMRSSLELFRVNAATGFQKLGSIDHTPLVQSSPQGYCGGYYRPSVRRGVFLDNFVYSISYGGVVVKNADDLTQQVSQLALSSPVVNEGYGPACY